MDPATGQLSPADDAVQYWRSVDLYVGGSGARCKPLAVQPLEPFPATWTGPESGIRQKLINPGDDQGVIGIYSPGKLKPWQKRVLSPLTCWLPGTGWKPPVIPGM